jgi:hypothetical protein
MLLTALLSCEETVSICWYSSWTLLLGMICPHP